MAMRDNFSRFISYRKEFPLFVFESYQYKIKNNYLDIRYHFSIPKKFRFSPSARIPWKEHIFRDRQSLSHEILDRLVFNMGMIELVSYWKATCSPTVLLPGKPIAPNQLNFWKKLYFHGLGEFFHLNSITTDMDTFMHLEGASSNNGHIPDVDLSGPALVPVGGGKDSAVTIGLLSGSGHEWIPLAINPLIATTNIISASGKSPEETIVIERRIDPLLLKLNARGYLNGHTPFSTVVAFYSLLAAYLSGSADIVLSNESSANEATIPGTNINHQYSKAFMFEKDFREYVRDNISPAFNYFSLLRPLTELQIARVFSSFPRFSALFRSCNVGSKKGEWCGKCPKCLFTWIILSPFLPQPELRRIFGKDLMADANLSKTLDELTGNSPVKPFECIGTVDEVNTALEYLAAHYPDKALPPLIRHYLAGKGHAIGNPARLEQRLVSWNPEHFVPEKYLQLLRYEKID